METRPLQDLRQKLPIQSPHPHPIHTKIQGCSLSPVPLPLDLLVVVGEEMVTPEWHHMKHQRELGMAQSPLVHPLPRASKLPRRTHQWEERIILPK